LQSIEGDRGPLPVGSTAPNFTLRRTFEESVILHELVAKGPVIVAFYVFDFGNI
jgi:peroxiredoxin